MKNTTRQPRRCGHCAVAATVRAGTRYGKYRPATGETEWFTTEAALAHLASLCRCPDREGSTQLREEEVTR